MSETDGKQLVMMADKDGMSCLDVACAEGHLDVIKYLSEKWGKDLVMKEQVCPRIWFCKL
jgi:ankyrin repeat protein